MFGKGILFWVMAGACCAAQAQESSFAAVRILVFDTFGHAVPGARVTLTGVGPSDKFSAVGGEAKFDRVPFGLYNLDVRLLGFLPSKERIRIYQPSITFRIGLELAHTHAYKRSEISGLVNVGRRERLDLWVRLIGIYTTALLENQVNASGTFKLNDAAPGKYILILFRNNKVLATKAVDVLEGKQTIEINPNGPN